MIFSSNPGARARTLNLAAKFRRWGMIGDARQGVMNIMSAVAVMRYRARHGRSF